jgi:hypothetical protein
MTLPATERECLRRCTSFAEQASSHRSTRSHRLDLPCRTLCGLYLGSDSRPGRPCRNPFATIVTPTKSRIRS